MTKPLSRRYVPLETFQRHCDAHGWWRVAPGLDAGGPRRNALPTRRLRW